MDRWQRCAPRLLRSLARIQILGSTLVSQVSLLSLVPYYSELSVFYFKLSRCFLKFPFLHLSGYLFGDSSAHEDGDGKTKFEQIVHILKQVSQYKDAKTGRDYSDYKIYITGHSLGTYVVGYDTFARNHKDLSKQMSSPTYYTCPVYVQFSKSHLYSFRRWCFDSDARLRFGRI